MRNVLVDVAVDGLWWIVIMTAAVIELFELMVKIVVDIVINETAVVAVMVAGILWSVVWVFGIIWSVYSVSYFSNLCFCNGHDLQRGNRTRNKILNPIILIDLRLVRYNSGDERVMNAWWWIYRWQISLKFIDNHRQNVLFTVGKASSFLSMSDQDLSRGCASASRNCPEQQRTT